ncbi:MAG: NAD(P)-dependent oxidoreductase, partial [Flavobacteriales bacterium]
MLNKNILVNDSFHSGGLKLLESKGFSLFRGNYEGDELIRFINKNNICILLVRSATKVNRQVIEACETLKYIGRGGVGMDNVDEVACKEKGIIAFNTPGGSTTAVAEMVFAHLLSMYRFVSPSNQLIKEDVSKVKSLKKEFSSGQELKGKTIGIWGAGRIGTEVARLALSFGMNVLAYHKTKAEMSVEFEIRGKKMEVIIPVSSMDDFLQNADIISLHVPHHDSPLITAEVISKMKDGTVFINTSRSSNVDEEALLKALQSGKISKAALDVFSSKVNAELLQHPNVSVTPHLGASTVEGQEKISMELAR